MKHLITFSVLAILLAGCGGSSGNGGSSHSSSTVPMDPDTLYDVYPGDRIIKHTDTAIVTISHIDGHQEATVSLKEGNASIIYR